MVGNCQVLACRRSTPPDSSSSPSSSSARSAHRIFRDVRFSFGCGHVSPAVSAPAGGGTRWHRTSGYCRSWHHGAALWLGCQGAHDHRRRSDQSLRWHSGRATESGTEDCTSSTAFEVMPETTFTFSSPGGDAVLMFQGQFGGFTSTAPNRPIVRLMVDGQNAGLGVVGSDLNGANQIHAFGYNAFTTLPRQPHGVGGVAYVLWRWRATSCVEERSLIVLHQ